jgi:hypothetical protein
MTESPTNHLSDLLPFEKEHFHPEYLKYFSEKRHNFKSSLKGCRGVWDSLQLLNDIWMREFGDLEHSIQANQMLSLTIFKFAHSKFLVAIELGFSCCVGDSYSILRNGIEATAHAHKIFREPALEQVWVKKATDKAAYNAAFEENKKKALYPDDLPIGKLHFYWTHFSESSTHSSANSIGLSFEEKEVDGTTFWGINYFQAKPKRLAVFFLALLIASSHMESVFFDCFEGRLKLDPELVTMRGTFAKMKEEQRHLLNNTYNLAGTSVWP